MTERIRDALIEVYNVLGLGYCEEVYREAVVHELRERGFSKITQEVVVPVSYKGYQLPHIHIRPDIVVRSDEGDYIIELKRVKNLNNSHKSQLRAYMRQMSIKNGILCNYPNDLDASIQLQVEDLDP